ncbi:hypothetical protein BJ165DRAFT_1428251 [Panaeolus papilionaceus]|nr:hypothetical protein BJ165DRAFT_1428251 [Panaeolus papilionaceus]
MTDFTLVDPRGWEYDLHSVYSAYIGYFQMYNVPWYERSWGHLFQSFEEFLAFDWPVITVTDTWTGRAHIVTRLTSIGAFLKMIKTRFGESIPQAPNILQVTPFETTNRHLRRVADYASYKKLHSTLPAAVLSALRARVKTGSPNAIKDVWESKDKSFLSISFEWSERNEKSVLEWGYAAVRCGHLEALGHWPPVPDSNYRKGHYIVAEYVDKVTNKYRPNYPWQYAFGESQVTPKSKLPQIIQAVISSLSSPDTETAPNHLVLVGHNMQGTLARLEEMKIKLPHNMLIIDTMIYERALYSEGLRGLMLDPKGNKQRAAGSSLSFEHLLYSLARAPPSPTSPDAEKQPAVVLPQCITHNSGNDALMCLFALQKLLDPIGTAVPTVKKTRSNRPGMAIPNPMMAPMGMPMMNLAATAGPFPYMGNPYATMPMSSSLPTMPVLQRPASSYDLAGEFGQMQMGMVRGNSSSVFLAAPTPPRTPGAGEKSKRFNSFFGVKSDDDSK